MVLNRELVAREGKNMKNMKFLIQLGKQHNHVWVVVVEIPDMKGN